MPLRSRLQLAALSVLVAAASACTDESPLLTGDPFFPDGRPRTLEVIFPAEEFLTLRGSFTGYSEPRDVSYTVVANEFDGSLQAHTLLRFPGAIPKEISFVQDGTTRSDSLYSVLGVELFLTVDSAASVGRDVALEALRLEQRWEDTLVTWTVRAASKQGAVLNWSRPGGTTGRVVGMGAYFPGDSVKRAVISIAQSEVDLLRDSTYFGLLVRAQTADSRVQITDARMRVSVRPSNGLRDTTIVMESVVEAQDFGFIFTPEPPQPDDVIRAGSIFSARTLFSMDLPDSVDVCTPGCERWALKDLALNRASLLLRPIPAPDGFRQLDSAAVGLRTIIEPELGALAPLGEFVTASFQATGFVVPATATFTPADTVVELPFTIHAARLLAGDSVPNDFALLAATTDPIPQPPFSLLMFDAEPRLRFVFTVPERPRLP